MLAAPTLAPDAHHHANSDLEVGLENDVVEPQRAANLRLLEDYPEPLTAEQRESLRRRTAALVHRYAVVRKGTRIIERGYKSLQSLLARLETQQSHLRGFLDALDKPNHTESIKELQPPAQSLAPSAEPVVETSETTASMVRPATRRGGGLLRSAAFANLRGVLSAAKHEEQQRRSTVTFERERVAKMTQLKMIEADIAEQQQHLAPLTEKYEKSGVLLESARREALEALQLYDDLQRMEVAYASRFFLRASGSRDNTHTDASDNAVDGTSTLDTTETGKAYDVFFAPATYSEEVQDMIREQVEEGLDEYLAYRRRVDPVLEALAEDRRAREARRADQLLQLIGLNTSSAQVGAGELAFASSTVSPPLGPMPAKRSGPVEVCRISDAEDESDGAGDESGEEGEPEEKQRGKIQTALAALDDFEELY